MRAEVSSSRHKKTHRGLVKLVDRGRRVEHPLERVDDLGDHDVAAVAVRRGGGVSVRRRSRLSGREGAGGHGCDPLGCGEKRIGVAWKKGGWGISKWRALGFEGGCAGDRLTRRQGSAGESLHRRRVLSSSHCRLIYFFFRDELGTIGHVGTNPLLARTTTHDRGDSLLSVDHFRRLE